MRRFQSLACLDLGRILRGLRGELGAGGVLDVGQLLSEMVALALLLSLGLDGGGKLDVEGLDRRGGLEMFGRFQHGLEGQQSGKFLALVAVGQQGADAAMITRIG